MSYGLIVVCPERQCGAPIGEPCVTASGRLRRFPHAARQMKAAAAPEPELAILDAVPKLDKPSPASFRRDLLDVDELPDGALAQLSFTDPSQLRLAF